MTPVHKWKMSQKLPSGQWWTQIRRIIFLEVRFRWKILVEDRKDSKKSHRMLPRKYLRSEEIGTCGESERQKHQSKDFTLSTYSSPSQERHQIQQTAGV